MQRMLLARSAICVGNANGWDNLVVAAASFSLHSCAYRKTNRCYGTWLGFPRDGRKVHGVEVCRPCLEYVERCEVCLDPVPGGFTCDWVDKYGRVCERCNHGMTPQGILRAFIDRHIRTGGGCSNRTDPWDGSMGIAYKKWEDTTDHLTGECANA